jgi:hypothetical protein
MVVEQQLHAPQMVLSSGALLRFVRMPILRYLQIMSASWNPDPGKMRA